MTKYRVTADVDSATYGKGRLEAYLDEAEFIQYANLSDDEKLDFLKNKSAKVQLASDCVNENEVSHYQVNALSPREKVDGEQKPSEVKTIRKMRMNINGQDTGWVDVTDENEAQYNAIMDRMKDMHQKMTQEFNHFFQPFCECQGFHLESPFFAALDHKEDTAK
ncbi:hypothetical protein CYJ27_03905 [Aerococcus christensenii]|uniref:Uncharacterized protein n=1 Tax=Aerococcus christensenii TaxID=87541 RepID=A0A2I1K853_9LACT|nr:hypothetical protein [Aerococcus christensenii]PKY91824.1 hypothetical protein CYJ27_03905 [Aerococcus christensenii]